MDEKLMPTNDAHPSEKVLSAFAVGRLDDVASVLVEHHVRECQRCAAVVADAPHDEFVTSLREAGSPQSAPPSRSPGDQLFPASLHDTTLPHSSATIDQHQRYEIIRLIGEGGTGFVYQARHRFTRTLVALKTIRPELATDRKTVERFLREARIAGQLAHENIAKVLDAEPLGETALVVSEFVAGSTLAQIVAKRGPLPVPDACSYARQVAVGLEYAASHGVVHRDIKPQNLMFEPATGTVRILDFGLGRLLDDERSRSGLTSDNQILGTPCYMAPEQAASSKSADIRSDIYSLGCTFYFLLAGEPPFQGRNVVEVLARHGTEQPLPIRELRRDVPNEVANLLDRMLAKDPSQRPQTPAEIAAALFPFTLAESGRNPSGPVEQKISQRPPAPSWSIGAIARAVRSPAILLPLLTTLLCLIALLL